MRVLIQAVVLIVSASAAIAAPSAEVAALSVVKVHAISQDGSVAYGSAVVIARDVVATACHVIRDANDLLIVRGESRSTATVRSGSATHDICLLNVPNLDVPAASLRASTSLRSGERVVAIGFPGGREQIRNDGVVEALYDFDTAHVIRTSAVFDFGASGGGLFDKDGALVGILAFKGRRGTKLHFAIPAEWARTALEDAAQSLRHASGRAFWEGPRAAQPSFLGRALMEAASQR